MGHMNSLYAALHDLNEVRLKNESGNMEKLLREISSFCTVGRDSVLSINSPENGEISLVRQSYQVSCENYCKN